MRRQWGALKTTVGIILYIIRGGVGRVTTGSFATRGAFRVLTVQYSLTTYLRDHPTE
jgi:hypothetical protein